MLLVLSKICARACACIDEYSPSPPVYSKCEISKHQANYWNQDGEESCVNHYSVSAVFPQLVILMEMFHLPSTVSIFHRDP